jgi:hypothetical protein
VQRLNARLERGGAEPDALDFHDYETITEYLQLCKDVKDCVDLKKYE